MKKINSSDFQSIQEILSTMTLDVKISEVDIEALKTIWRESVGEKISKLSIPDSFSDDGILTIGCESPLVANELYLECNNLLQIMREKTENTGIEIKGLKFETKKNTRG